MRPRLKDGDTVKDVGGGKLIAKVKDAAGNTMARNRPEH
jgi:hypothetical protein